MKYLSFIIVLFLSVSGTLIGQEEKDYEKIKKELLKKLEQKIKEEEERLLKELEQLIDEELAKLKDKKDDKKDDQTNPPKPLTDEKPAKKRGYLGIRPRDLWEDEREELELKKGGVVIAEILPNTAADKADLQEDDIILKVDDTEIEDIRQLIQLLQSKGAGIKIKLFVLRDKKEKEVEVELGVHPQDAEKVPEKKIEKDGEDESERKMADEDEDENEGEDENEDKEAPKERKTELRKKIEKFLLEEEKAVRELRKQLEEAWKKVTESDEFQSFINELRDVLKESGIDPDEIFEKDEEGNWKLSEEYRKLLEDAQQYFSKVLKNLRARSSEETLDLKPLKRPIFGIKVAELTDEQRARYDLEEDIGVIVKEVKPASPAEDAGIKKGDILLEINGKDVKGELTLRKFFEKVASEDTIELKILRDNDEHTVKVKLKELEEDED